MSFSFEWPNGFALIAPILLWNFIFAGRLEHGAFKADKMLPSWMLYSEHALRLPFFTLPFFMPLNTQTAGSLSGHWLFGVGAFVYLLSWLPLVFLPERAWSNSRTGVLAPHILPLFWGLGLARICNNWLYGLVAILFTAVHVMHGWAGYSKWREQLFKEN